MSQEQQPIYVTEPFLPPLEEFTTYLERIWQSRRLTNSGPFHEQLESELASYLGVAHLSLFSNGTLALMTALQALKVGGEVITTPFTFAATAHALIWNRIKPVFVDIDPATCNLDPECIERAITPETSAILPVHCYGLPCDVARIEQIARKHQLQVIYDAAHAFGVQHHQQSLLRYGDLSVLSFHATKVFNTFEGGAIICPNREIKVHIDHLKNFGFVDEITVVEAGINGKMNEVQAAMGLLQLQHIDTALAARARIYQAYRDALRDTPTLRMLEVPEHTRWNHAYCPILVTPGHPLSRDTLYALLKAGNIHTRRYFFPLVSDMPMYRHLAASNVDPLIQAQAIAAQVLCLPIYPGLQSGTIARIVDILKTDTLP